MKKILVPCDFSSCCDNAVGFAIELAAKCNGEVIIITVVKLPEQISGNKDLDMAKKQAITGFAKIENTYTSPVKIRQEIIFGKTLPEILACISRERIDLVIMGTKGSRGWQQTFMGSTTEKVVRTSPVPVFSIKSNTALGSIRNIVLPSDLRHYPSEFIENVKCLRKIFHARLHLLWINKDAKVGNESLKLKLQEHAAHYDLDDITCSVRFNEDETEGIINFARETNADMIAMATHGNLDMGHLFTTSVAADVMNHTSLPTWTCAVTRKFMEPGLYPAGSHVSTDEL